MRPITNEIILYNGCKGKYKYATIILLWGNNMNNIKYLSGLEWDNFVSSDNKKYILKENKIYFKCSIKI